MEADEVKDGPLSTRPLAPIFKEANETYFDRQPLFSSNAQYYALEACNE